MHQHFYQVPIIIVIIRVVERSITSIKYFCGFQGLALHALQFFTMCLCTVLNGVWSNEE